ncbi:MAG TPA: hypothetical protein VES59_11520 [Bacteroidota bacterium]|nr:hypothetical protein [Bacteroidota bacterium]
MIGQTNKPASPIPDLRVRRLYHWLSYHRLTLFIYGAAFVYPPQWILAVLTFIAVIFVPYMIYVLYGLGKRGWLVLLAVMVGLPVGLTFVPFNIPQLHTVVLFLPLGMFYLYCVLLRWAVADWISDESADGEAAVEAEDRRENVGNW